MVYHKNLTGADLHYARAIVGSGTPVGTVSASIGGQLYLDKTNVNFYAAGTAGTAYWNKLGGVNNHNSLSNLSYASAGHTGFAQSVHTHTGVYSTTGHIHSIYNTVVMEDRRGTGCSGVTGATSRILTLGNTATLKRAEMIAVNGVWLHQPDYTKSTAATNATITFTNAVWNEDYIRVIYFQ